MSPCDTISMVHVARVSEGAVHGSEKLVVVAGTDRLQTEHGPTDGRVHALKSGSPREVVDSDCTSAKALCELFESEIIECGAQDTLLILHLEATPMKMPDPIVFARYTQNLYKDVFEKPAVSLEENQVKAILGLGDALENIKKVPEEKRADTEADIEAGSATRPVPAMADSKKGVTNSRAPSDAPVDASIPAMIRGMGGWEGGTWCPGWKPEDKDCNVCCTKAKIPDRAQEGMFVDAVEFYKKNGACISAAMGSVAKDVVMPQRPAEYGSHDKTFETPGAGGTPLATNLTTIVIQTAITQEEVGFYQPSSSMKRSPKFDDLLDPFVRQPPCMAGILLK